MLFKTWRWGNIQKGVKFVHVIWGTLTYSKTPLWPCMKFPFLVLLSSISSVSSARKVCLWVFSLTIQRQNSYEFQRYWKQNKKAKEKRKICSRRNFFNSPVSGLISDFSVMTCNEQKEHGGVFCFEKEPNRAVGRKFLRHHCHRTGSRMQIP